MADKSAEVVLELNHRGQSFLRMQRSDWGAEDGAVALRRAITIYGRRYLQMSAIYSGDTV